MKASASRRCRLLSLSLAICVTAGSVPAPSVWATPTSTLRGRAARQDPRGTDDRIETELIARTSPHSAVTLPRRVAQAALIAFVIDLAASVARATFEIPSSGDHYSDVLRLLGGTVAFVIGWTLFGGGLSFAKRVQADAGSSQPPPYS